MQVAKQGESGRCQGPKGGWDVQKAKVYPGILPKGRYEGFGKTQKTQFQDVNLLWALWVAPTFSLSGLPSEAMLVFGFPF